MKVLDIGCGTGGSAFYMAKNFGCEGIQSFNQVHTICTFNHLVKATYWFPLIPKYLFQFENYLMAGPKLCVPVVLICRISFRTRAIISRGLYIFFTPFPKTISLFLRRFFSENSDLMYGLWLVFKSGL